MKSKFIKYNRNIINLDKAHAIDFDEQDLEINIYCSLSKEATFWLPFNTEEEYKKAVSDIISMLEPAIIA